MSLYSTPKQLEQIKSILSLYTRLPFSPGVIPGGTMENVLAHVRNAQVLNTYDFVDVVKPDQAIGWQIKSTKEGTPVTWKRAKIPNRTKLIEQSQKGAQGLQRLGDAIIHFCNEHARESLEKYNLNEIGYCRLIIHNDGKVTYFERELCTRTSPQLFNPREFQWQWSKQKKTKGKEQLQALHGYHIKTKKKWWAWHGLGENQLHFSGEETWWPNNKTAHAVTFRFPAEDVRIPIEKLARLVADLERSA